MKLSVLSHAQLGILALPGSGQTVAVILCRPPPRSQNETISTVTRPVGHPGVARQTCARASASRRKGMSPLTWVCNGFLIGPVHSARAGRQDDCLFKEDLGLDPSRVGNCLRYLSQPVRAGCLQ